MTRTPDEIKKGLECCTTDKCKECPYYPLYEVFGCKLARAKDALALIQQLEVDNSQLRNYIRLLQSERDAAVKTINEMAEYIADMDYYEPCKWCAQNDCKSCSSYFNFKWRGVQKEDGNG